MRNLGFVLIALAVMVFLYQGVTTTRREKVLGLGFAESVKTPEKTSPSFLSGRVGPWLAARSSSPLTRNGSRTGKTQTE